MAYRDGMEPMKLSAEDRELAPSVRRVVYADDVIDLRYLFRSWWGDVPVDVEKLR